VVARQVWFNLLQPLNLGDYIPRQQECSFAEWWRKLMKRVKKEYKRGVILSLFWELGCCGITEMPVFFRE